MVRKLTDRQIAVLAAIERLGRPTLPELRHDLPALTQSEITRVVAALVIRGLVARGGQAAALHRGAARQPHGQPRLGPSRRLALLVLVVAAPPRVRLGLRPAVG